MPILKFHDDKWIFTYSHIGIFLLQFIVLTRNKNKISHLARRIVQINLALSFPDGLCATNSKCHNFPMSSRTVYGNNATEVLRNNYVPT